MGDYIQGLSQTARDSLEDVLLKIRDGLQPTTSTTSGTLVGTGALTLTGNYTGTGILGASLASIAGAQVYSTASLQNALVLTNNVLSSPTVAPLQMIASSASQAFFDFQGAVISTASLNLSAGQLAGMVQVRFIGTGGQGQGYIPIFKGIV